MNSRIKAFTGPAVSVIALAGALVATPVEVRGDESVIPRFAVEIDSGRTSVKETGFGSGWRYGGGVFFRTGHRMGVEIMLESFGVPVAAGTDNLVSAGKMTMTTLLINEQLFVLTHGRILPYALMGIGFSFISFAPDDWPADLPQRDVVDRMALQLGAGLIFRITRSLSVTGKARYNLVKTWIENPGPKSGDPIRDTNPLEQSMLHLYGLELGLGVRLGF
jgi:opacity protein-like surface antigen